MFPDVIFLILVASQWFMAAWSILGAVLYFRLFESGKSCDRESWVCMVMGGTVDNQLLDLLGMGLFKVRAPDDKLQHQARL